MPTAIRHTTPPRLEPDEPSTRDRILAAALRRFIDQGFDATSLREIAEDLGFTKAALYYHFKTKDELLDVLLEPMSVMMDEFRQRILGATTVEEWGDGMLWAVDAIIDHLELLRLLHRNRAMIERNGPDDPMFGEHAEIQRQIENTIRALSPDPVIRARLIASIAAVTGFDDWAPNILLEFDRPALVAATKDVIRDILHLPQPPATPA